MRRRGLARGPLSRCALSEIFFTSSRADFVSPARVSVHYRQRHFQRILEQRKQDKRWSLPPTKRSRPLHEPTSPAPTTAVQPIPHTTKPSAAVIAPQSVSSPSSTGVNVNLIEATDVATPDDASGVTAISPSLVLRHGWRRWATGIAAHSDAHVALTRADSWSCAASRRQAMLRLRVHRSAACLMARADQRRTERCFAAMLRAGLWRALGRAESAHLLATWVRRRGMRALVQHTAVRRRLAAAAHFHAVRACLTGLTLWRCAAELCCHRTALHHAAVVRHKWCVRLATLRHWGRLTTLTFLLRAAWDVADRVCNRLRRRRALRTWSMWAQSAAQQQPQQQPQQQSHQQSQQQSQTPATQQRPTAGSPSSEEQLENMEVAARRAIARALRRTDEAEERALAAEARAEAAEARAVAAEARAVAADTVAAEARCAPSNADEIAAVRAAMRTAFERERHQLLRKLGDALASDAASRRQLHEYQRYRDGASAVAAPGGAVQATPAEATPAEAVATPEVPVLLVARRRSRVVAAGPTASPAEASATPEVPTQPVARRRSRVIRVT